MFRSLFRTSILRALVALAILPLITAATPLDARAETRTLRSFVVNEAAGGIDGYWRTLFDAAGLPYSSPHIVLFDPTAKPIRDACSPKPVAGLVYCSADKTIYLDVSRATSVSFGQLWANDNNFTIVTILAHEWGHYAQDILGISSGGVSQLDLEHQADCLSGVFALYSESQGWLQTGDFEAAERLALRSGDRGHGRGWERVRAFEQGYFDNPQISPAVCSL
jgi:predicted metalloprotease